MKFSKASKMLYDLSVKAEGLLAFNNPAMMVAVYFCIISVSWFGAQYIVGGSMTTGDLTSLFSYIMSLLMSLMMLSMVVVMISMSLASIRRISEVLNEKADPVSYTHLDVYKRQVYGIGYTWADGRERLSAGAGRG